MLSASILFLLVQITAAIIPYFVVNCMSLKTDVPSVIIAVQGTVMRCLYGATSVSG